MNGSRIYRIASCGRPSSPWPSSSGAAATVHGKCWNGWPRSENSEALISLSTYSYEHPEDTFPELIEKGPEFEAEGLGHPTAR